MVQFITDKINFFLTPVIVAMGLVLNLLTIMVFCRRKMKKYCLSVSMISLAVCDILILAVPVLITWIDDNFFDSYLVNNTVWCNLHGYTDLILSANSSWIIILISVERWFAVWRPWEKSTKFTNRRMRITLLALFAISLALFSYFPLSLQITTRAPPVSNNFTSTVITTSTSRNESLNECNIQMPRLYSIMGIVSVLLVYVVPLIVLAFLNGMIIHKLRQRPFRILTQTSKQQQQRSSSHLVIGVNNEMTDQLVVPPSVSMPNELLLATTTTTTTSVAPSGKRLTSSSTNNTSKADQNLSITLVTVAVSFMILILPFQAFWFYDTFFKSSSAADDDGSSSTDNEQNLRNMTFIIKNMNYLINFFLYSALSKLFRSEFIALVLDDKFFIIGKCIKCVFFEKKKKSGSSQTTAATTAANNQNKQKEQNSHSSFAEVNFSLSTLKKLKSGDFYNAKYIQIQVDPANFVRYFRGDVCKAKTGPRKALCSQVDDEKRNQESSGDDVSPEENPPNEMRATTIAVTPVDCLDDDTPVKLRAKRANSYPTRPPSLSRSSNKTVVKQYKERKPNMSIK